MAQAWHRQIFQGVHLPVPYYAGEIRDSDPSYPELFGYEVAVGVHRGVGSRRVPAELAWLEKAMQEAASKLDAVIQVGSLPADKGELRAVLTFAAHAHGEWVRIHPFANGNGRIARLWANWCALRYGLPLFIRLRPRPKSADYAEAASDSMRGDHRKMLTVFTDMLQRRLREGP